MKRFLVLLLLFALPLHFSWAVAASYCQHENDQAAHHFGHHGHQHQESAPSHDDGGASPLQVHADCSFCHLSSPVASLWVATAPIMPGASFATADPVPALPSIVPDGPERPKWAADGRSAGPTLRMLAERNRIA